MADRKPVYVEKGKRYFGFMPASEACMHMRISGKCMMFEIVGDQYPMVQLLRADGSMFSFPITTGEAGIYRDNRGMYYYPPLTYGTDVDEAAYGAALQILEVQDYFDTFDYYSALVAMAVKAGWTFKRVSLVDLMVEMTLPVHGSQVRRGPGIMEFMVNCLDPDGEVAHLFVK